MSKRIPFNVKFRPQIESGDYKVETRDGKPVRIICWDMDSYNQIVALVANYPNYNGSLSEHIFSYGMNGRYSATAENAEDLFIVTPEPEMSEFEQEVSDIVDYCKEHGANVLSDYAKRHAKALLAIAKSQLLRSGELLTQEHHEKLMETQYKETLDGVKKNWHDYFTPQAVTDIYNAGRNDVLKDLPRWSKGSIEGDRIVGLSLYHNMKWILFSDLEKLLGRMQSDQEIMAIINPMIKED